MAAVPLCPLTSVPRAKLDGLSYSWLVDDHRYADADRRVAYGATGRVQTVGAAKKPVTVTVVTPVGTTTSTTGR